MSRHIAFGHGAVTGLILGAVWAAWPAIGGTFDRQWRGRVAIEPASGVASIYWAGKVDARGVRFNPDRVSCAHRTEPLGSILVVIHQKTGRKIDCPVWDRGPYHGGRVLDLTRGAAREIGCSIKAGLCDVIIKRKGFE